MKKKYILFTVLVSTLILMGCKKNDDTRPPDKEEIETFGELTAEIQSDEGSLMHKTTFKMSQMIGREGDLYELYIMAVDDDKSGSIVIKAMVNGKGTYRFSPDTDAQEPYGDVSYVDDKLNSYYADANSSATGDCELTITEFPDKLTPAKPQKIKAVFSADLYDMDGKNLKINNGRLDGYVTSWD